ncbi:hypothetical protein PLESTF_000182700 [Pleodorina starrii]|nr:hypothetical protein PLESTM_000139200 [Pleodorina starrii]GLC64595.1 hypothetical protein PLESTF_000182700 [Pleodorina starrii]
MTWWKGSVAPGGDDGPLEFADERRGCSGWMRRHPVIASVSITFLILGIITVIVVPITCSVHGCPPKKQEAPSDPLYKDAPLRLVLSFNNDLDIASLVPKLLQSYTSRVQMALSNLQILEASNSVILEAIIKEVNKRTDLEFIVRDFVLTAPLTILGGKTGASSGRRLQQTSGGGAAGLNDPGLASAYWFNQINVTGAWQLLGINISNPQRQMSDVVIAVTDSGVVTSHPDLIGSFWNNPDEIDDDLADNDNNTFIDDFYGACFSTVQCSPTYIGSGSNNVSRCGIGRNTSTWNGIIDRTSHGTKIAGIIGAAPNNGIGLAGVAPNLRQMILKVTDESFDPANPPYAFSDVVRAVDYAYNKGARIFSMSFGANAKSSMTAFNKPSLDNAASAYRTLFLKYSNALFIAAAGNEWTNLENWRAANFTYSPCMVDAPNVLCVGGTTANDTIFYTYLMNQDMGTNYGPNSVDMGAPGMNIYTTDTPFNGYYGIVSGTSFSTPMTAAAAGLVLAALGGQTRATSQTPALIKNILMTSGDEMPSMQGTNVPSFRSTRRLNVGNAVAAALTLARTNRTVVKRARTFESVAASVVFQGWEYTWARGVYTDGRFDWSDRNYEFADFYVRNQPTTNFNILRYPATDYVMMATAMARIDTPGMYSIQYRATAISPSRWQLIVGENPLVWNQASSTVGTVDLIFPDVGFYNMTLWMYPESGSSLINFLWQTPGSPATWISPPFSRVLHDTPPSRRYYDPGATPRPAMWHVVWNETASFGTFSDPDQRGFFVKNKDPWLYRGLQTMVSDFNFPTGTDLRNALYNGTSAPSNGNTVVYGYARANLRPLNFSTGISFRLQGPHSRLYVNDQLVFDFQSETQLMIVSPCITLQNNTAHEIYFYFAARMNVSNPVGLTWATCTGTAVPTGTSGQYTSMTGSLATNFFWAPATSTVAALPRGFRCDAWPGSLSVSALGTTPAVGTPPTLTWMYPRDCPSGYRTGSECRMQTRLEDLFGSGNVTWPVWNIRCYTYWSASLARGLTGAQVLGGPIFQHLAGVRVYFQPGGPSTFNYAPYVTRFPPGVFQLYVIEWVALGQQWNPLATQTIWDGVTSSFNVADALTTNRSSMVLPASADAPFAWLPVTSA